LCYLKDFEGILLAVLFYRPANPRAIDLKQF